MRVDCVFAFLILKVFSEILGTVLETADFRLIKPLYLLALLPYSLLYGGIFMYERAKAVAFAIFPKSLILSTISKYEHTVTALQVLFVFTYILLSVWPRVHPDSMHLISPPLPLILSAIGPAATSEATYRIFLPLTFISRPILPFILAKPMPLDYELAIVVSINIIKFSVATLAVKLSRIEILLKASLLI